MDEAACVLPGRRYMQERLPAMFLYTHGQVDEQTRGKMAEMLPTCRTGGSDGRELFGVGTQVAIYRGT